MLVEEFHFQLARPPVAIGRAAAGSLVEGHLDSVVIKLEADLSACCEWSAAIGDAGTTRFNRSGPIRVNTSFLSSP
jgi:hypothetical protein